MRSIVYLFMILVLSFVQAAAQDGAKEPVLVDGFERIQCEDARSRMDNFMAELSNSPGDRGVIVVHPKASDPIRVFRQLQDFLAQARFRNFYMDRLDVIVGPHRDAQLIEFWRVPAGASQPKPKPSDLGADAAKYQVKRAVQFGTTISSEESGCVSMPFDLEAFALALTNLDGVRGRITVKGPNANKALKRIKELHGEMRGYSVEEPTVRTTFVKAKREVTELWIEPAVKK